MQMGPLESTARWLIRRLLSNILKYPADSNDSTSLGETLCLMCRQVPKQTKSHFCSKACTDQAEKAGPMILEVPAGHVTFKSGE